MEDNRNTGGSPNNPGSPYRPSTPYTSSSSSPYGNSNLPPRPGTPNPNGTGPNTPRPSTPNYNNPIDVTKPRSTYDRNNRPEIVDEEPVYVPTDKEREQAALERLRKRASGLDDSPSGKPARVKAKRDKGDSSKRNKSIIAIILVLLIVAMIAFFLFFLSNQSGGQEESYDIRVSMKIENKSALSLVTETGQEILREIAPGDKIPLRAYARNSEDYRGDPSTSQSDAAKNIYIRFKIVVILDYEERNEIVAPNIGEMWYRYNHEDESQILNGVQFDDGYFYYKDIVRFQQRIELFSELEFVGDNIFCEDGGKYGQIQVIVESIEAVPENIINGSVWPTAPKHWVLDITN